MAYVPNPGQFSLFKNDKKEKETHPDYKGDGLSLDGRAVWVSAWIKEGSKGRFMSCTFKYKDEAQQSKPAQQKPKQKMFDSEDDMNDAIPF